MTSVVLTVSLYAHAVTILSGPTFTPATKAPLAGLLQLTTDADSRISVLVSDGTDYWQRDFYDYATTHSVPLLGFKPDQTNQILITVYDKAGNSFAAPQLLTFVTAPLPALFPAYTILQSQPDEMEPGYLFFAVRNNTAKVGYIVEMDNSGNVVWYTQMPNVNDLDIRRLDNGDIFVNGNTGTFTEYNMLGQTVNVWNQAPGFFLNGHDGFPTGRGTILYVGDQTEMVSNFPSNNTDPNAPVGTVKYDDNPIVEISMTNSELLNSWSPLDLGLVDPTRITYTTYGSGSGSTYGTDAEHGNAVLEDTNSDSLIESFRNENEVVKFSRSTGQIKWILGPHAGWGAAWQPYLLNPVGTPFDWNYGQHAPELTTQGTLLVYNDNNFNASPFDTLVPDQENHSDAIEYSIDETNMLVSEVWNSSWQTNQDRLFTPYVGRVQWLPQTRNVLVDYGAVSYVNGAHPDSVATNAIMVRIIEYTHDPVPQVVFDVSFFDNQNTNPAYAGSLCYRAYQIPDLYVHPTAPVSNLAMSVQNQIPLLTFSADPTHTYLIQASTDMSNWTDIGTAVPEDGVGDFVFQDLQANQFGARFYRVLVQ